jgi:hypothetical protein
MNEHSDLERRLRALGDEPVDPTVASYHLTAMAAAAPAPKAARLHRPKVVAAFFAGLLLGGTSLASAGALGDTPQNAVADVAAKVGVNLPGGSVERSTEGCNGVTYKNHGQFVKAGGDPESPCGKPLHSVDKDGEEGEQNKSPDETKAPKVEKDENGKPIGTPAQGEGKPDGTPGNGPSGENGEGCGPPSWAHGDKAARTPEAVAAFAASCPNDAAAEREAPEAKDKEETPEVTTTTEAPPETTTTTEAPPDTTTTTTGE